MLVVRRSEIRIMEWKQTFFQLTNTIYNKNQRIDDIMVKTSAQIAVLIENRLNQNSIFHIYNYKYSTMDGETSIEFKRVQLFSTPLDLSNSQVYLFNEYDNQHLQMVICDKHFLEAVQKNRCEYYLWRDNGIENNANFKKLDKRIQLLDSLSNESFETTHGVLNMNHLFVSKSILVFLSKVSVDLVAMVK